MANGESALTILRLTYGLLPLIAGIDKFTHILTDWHEYLAPFIEGMIPGDPHILMYAVGVIEILAGLLVLARPRIGAPIVFVWLLAITVNLLATSYWDVALRDAALAGGALALTRLASGAPAEAS